MNTLNYSNASNRNKHAFQLLFVPLESIIFGTEGSTLTFALSKYDARAALTGSLTGVTSPETGATAT